MNHQLRLFSIRRRTPRCSSRACLAALLALGLIGAAPVLRADEPQPPGTRAAALAEVFTGSLVCKRCHNTKDVEGFNTAVSTLDEYAVWHRADKHEYAFRALGNDRGQRMLKRLGHERDQGWIDTNCVSCHGVGSGRKHGPDFRQDDGVTCVQCHGAHAEWIPAHGIDWQSWRALSAETKEARFGMTDLRHPAKRASLCVSCHVGSSREGRRVTHAMFAAGHPPLPSLEVSIFLESMPPHWRPSDQRDPAINRQLYRLEPGDFEQTRTVVVSSAAVFHDVVEFFGAEAARGGAWPELAQFDCTACHHALTATSWRQQRGYPTAPGRPALRAWPQALGPVVLAAAASNAGEEKALAQAYEQHLGKLYGALSARPFGKPAEIAAAASALAAWTQQEILPRVERRRYDATTAQALFARFADVNRYPDYDSARQLAWSLGTIGAELARRTRWDQSSAFQEWRNHVDPLLQLELPAGKNQAIEAALGPWLEKVSQFKAEDFRKDLDALFGRNEAAKPKS